MRRRLLWTAMDCIYQIGARGGLGFSPHSREKRGLRNKKQTRSDKTGAKRDQVSGTCDERRVRIVRCPRADPPIQARSVTVPPALMIMVPTEGVELELCIYGGGAMMLAYNSRET